MERISQQYLQSYRNEPQNFIKTVLLHFLNSEDINIDYEQLERIACLDVQPHVLILPSDFQHFFKDVNGCFVMNPQRLTRGDGGNVFSRMVIRGPSSETKDFSTQVCAETVRI